MSQKTPFRFLIPRGRLFERVCKYLAIIGIVIDEPDRSGYCGSMKVADIDVEFWIRKPSMIPRLLTQESATILFQAGMTGEDMMLASGIGGLDKVATLTFSSRTFRPTRWVLAGLREQLGGRKLPVIQEHSLKIGCEWLRLGEKLLQHSSISNLQVELVPLCGNEESAICNGLCEWVICPTETGESLSESGLEAKVELMDSFPCIFSRTNLSEKHRKILDGIVTALGAADAAAQQVMVTFDISAGKTAQITFPDYVISPTILPLLKEGWEAGEICIKRADLLIVLPTLKDAGARRIVVADVQAYIE